MESDESLYERVQKGDLAAFDILYQRYERRLFGFIRGYLREQDEAEDLFHETFMTILRRGDANFQTGSFRSWLYQIARNLSLNRLRSLARGKRARRALAQAAPECVADAPTRMEQRQVAEALSHAVSRLPQTLSELFRMRAAGMSYEEMSQVLSIPLGTVKSRMHELVKELKKEMQPWTAQ